MTDGLQVTDTFDTLLTTTLRKYRKKLIDNIFEPLRFLKWLMKERGGGKSIGTFDLVDGGHEVVEHLMYGKNTTFQWFTGMETQDTTIQEGITIAKYPWASLGGSIAYNEIDKLKNSGESQMIDLVKAKIKQAEMSARDKLSQSILADPGSVEANAINSVLEFINDDPTAASDSVGGHSGNSKTWWRNYESDCGAFTTNLQIELETMVNTLTKDGGIHLLLCSQGAYEYYNRLAGDGTIASTRRFVDEQKTLDLGFEVQKYRGIDMFFDFDLLVDTPITGDTIVGINKNHLRLVMHKNANFRQGPFMQPHDQFGKVALILALCSLCMDNRRAHGIIHGIDAS